jgi:hypothetical protein
LEELCYLKSTILQQASLLFNNYDISANEELNEENYNLTEDMLQVEFNNNVTLDVGWYIGIKCFIVFVIKDYDWEKPMLRLEAHSYMELENSLDKAMNLIKGELI